MQRPARIVAIVVVLGFAAAACGADDAETLPEVQPTPTPTVAAGESDTTAVAPTPTPAPAWPLPEPDVTTLLESDATATYIRLRSDGERLWAMRRDDTNAIEALVRLDPSTGQELAELDLPADVGVGRPNYRLGIGELWVETGTTELSRVEPDTLEVLDTIEVRPNIRAVQTYLPTEDLWVSYRQPTTEARTGEEVFMGAELHAPDGSVERSLEFPACGVRDTLSVGDEVWLSISCRNQIVIADPATGGQEVIAPYPSNARMLYVDDTVWAAFGNTGVVARIDIASRTVVSGYRVLGPGEGPVLSSTIPVGLTTAGVLVLAVPVDEQSPPVLALLDRQTGAPVGRLLMTGATSSAAVVGDTVVVSLAEGGLVSVGIDQFTDVDDADALLAEPQPPPTEAVPTTPDEEEVVAAFQAALARDAAPVDAITNIEDGDGLLTDWEELHLAATTTFADVRIVLSSLHIVDDRADITYAFLIGDEPAFLPRPGVLIRNTEDRWLLARQTFCDLAAAALQPCDG